MHVPNITVSEKGKLTNNWEKTYAYAMKWNSKYKNTLQTLSNLFVKWENQQIIGNLQVSKYSMEKVFFASKMTLLHEFFCLI